MSAYIAVAAMTMLASLAMLAVTKVPAVDRRITLAATPRAARRNRNKLAADLGNQYLFAVPSRDRCLFWTASSPAEVSEKHAVEAHEDF